MIIRCFVVVLAFLNLAVSTVQAIPGQPGTLDASWGTLSPLGPGKIATSVGGTSDIARGMVIQPDGKVVIAGSCVSAAVPIFCAARYNSDGSLDASFNGVGFVLTSVGATSDIATAVALQADGKIILSGYCFIAGRNNFCAVRYNANGTLDTTFNGSGKVNSTVLATSTSANATAVAVQPDGRIVQAGYCVAGFNLFCAARYNTDGSLDTSFGTTGTGTVFTIILANDDRALAIALQPDNKIVLAGTCMSSVNADFCAVRYNVNGSLDSSFNGTGFKAAGVGNATDQANSVVIQPDGKIVLAGTCFVTGIVANNFCVQRYNANGSSDLSFYGVGKVITDLTAGSQEAYSLTLQADGKLILSGRCADAGGNIDFCAARYHSDGQLDVGFNNSGKFVTPITTGNDSGYASALQRDGKLLLAGTCYTSGSNTGLCIARYDGGPFGYRACSADIDGDGRVLATTDSLIHARIALGITGNAVTNGISFPPTATRNTWPLIRDYLVSQCGMSLVQ